MTKRNFLTKRKKKRVGEKKSTKGLFHTKNLKMMKIVLDRLLLLVGLFFNIYIIKCHFAFFQCY